MTATLAAPREQRDARHLAPWLWAGPVAAAAGTAAVLAWDPFERSIEVCWLHAATGLLCPACGATRAWYLLAQGDVGGALRHNALFVLVAVWLVGLWAVLAWRHVRRVPSGERWPPLLRPVRQLGTGVRVAALAGLVAFSVARNLPGLDWLGPV